ncbi:hypothetical protein KDX38_29225, partial [Pseudomonas sp. CDFA 602]
HPWPNGALSASLPIDPFHDACIRPSIRAIGVVNEMGGLKIKGNGNAVVKLMLMRCLQISLREQAERRPALFH